MNLKFSVLISIYYKEVPKYLEEALKSIIDDQELKPNQIVLVKDGPLTLELDFIIDKYVTKYKEIFKIISLEENCGLGRALNIGLKNCDYELVARMDGDDISKPNRFKEQIEEFKKNPSLDVVGSWIEEFEMDSISNRKIKSIRNVPEKNEDIYKELKSTCALNHPTVMYRRLKVMEAGSYCQSFVLEDYYLWIKLALNNCNFYNIQKSLLYFRITSETFKRRGGVKLLKSDLKFQKELLNRKFISKKECLKNLILYSAYRLFPWKIRKNLQKIIFRKKYL